MDPLVVGSSSTWTQEELDLFHVRVERDVDVREMIPEKFFDFSTLKNYHAGRRYGCRHRLVPSCTNCSTQKISLGATGRPRQSQCPDGQGRMVQLGILFSPQTPELQKDRSPY